MSSPRTIATERIVAHSLAMAGSLRRMLVAEIALDLLEEFQRFLEANR